MEERGCGDGKEGDGVCGSGERREVLLYTGLASAKVAERSIPSCRRLDVFGFHSERLG
jgi:hypothetical protein